MFMNVQFFFVNLLNKPKFLCYITLQDEMLARFVVNSHVKHHPNAVNNKDDDDEDNDQQVGMR